MLRRRKRPEVLAEISVPRNGSGLGSLGRTDLEAFAGLSKALTGSSAVLMTGGASSTVALGFATAAAAEGKRVALLECDLAAPALAGMLGLAADPGLHEYLRGEAEAPQILQSLVLAGPASARATAPLVCVVAGRPSSSTAELLATEDFHYAVERLCHAYDLLVIDGPPSEKDGGALKAVASQVDATLACGARAEIPKRLPVPVAGLVIRG